MKIEDIERTIFKRNTRIIIISFCFGFMIQKVNFIRVIVVIIKIKVNLIHNFNSYFNLYFKCSADIQ